MSALPLSRRGALCWSGAPVPVGHPAHDWPILEEDTHPQHHGLALSLTHNGEFPHTPDHLKRVLIISSHPGIKGFDTDWGGALGNRQLKISKACPASGSVSKS